LQRVKREKTIEFYKKTPMEIQGKKITVVGLGRSGIGAANLLSKLGADVTATDRRPEGELADFRKKLTSSVRLSLGGHPEDLFMSADMIIISPGVPLSVLPLSKAREKGIPIIGELELAYQIITQSIEQKTHSLFNPPISPLLKGGRGGFLAVTGTNGKSTTASLLDVILRKGGFRTILGGNIGNALTEEIYKMVTGKVQETTIKNSSPVTRHSSLDYIVAEISSFQLETIKDFRPRGAAILNITPDHLDRYHSIEEYSEAKARIFDNQRGGDFLLLNADDPKTVKVSRKKLMDKRENPSIFYFSREKEVEGIYFKDGRIYCNFPDLSLITRHSSLIHADEIKIKGVHNLENAMAASAMALLAGSPIEAIRDSLIEFPGLEHRLEFVREIDGIRYVNDSKGTNVGAVVKSLESFKEPVILIAGGRDKAGDFSPLRSLIKERVRALVLIGEAREKIKKALGDLTETVIVKDLKEAVCTSHSIAVRGDVVLLSPACASFDMFLDFEDRGRQFKKVVMELT
jgi:UDP-N-acetylmuramoylalanine--D-glutamate ligase